MAITVDKLSLGTVIMTGGNDGGAGLKNFVTNQTVAAGAFIVMGWGCFGGEILLSVAGGGLTWSIDSHTNGSNSKESAIVSAQAPSGLASGTTITATFQSTAASMTAGAMSFLGVKTSSPKDGAGQQDNGNPLAAWSSGSYAIQAGSVLVAQNWAEGPVTGSTATAGSEAWEGISVVDAYGVVMGYRIESVGGSYSVGGNWNAASDNSTDAQAYLAAPSGASSVLTADHGMGMGRW